MRAAKGGLLVSFFITVTGVVMYVLVLCLRNVFGSLLFADLRSCFLSVFVTGLTNLIFQGSFYFAERHKCLESVLQSIFIISAQLDDIEYMPSFHDPAGYEKAIQSYLKLYESIHEADLSGVFGLLDFLFGNQSIRTNLFCLRVYEPCQCLQKELIQLNRFVNKQPAPREVVCDQLVKLQNLLFRIEDTDRVRRAYRVFDYKLLLAAWEIAEICYGKNSVDKPKERLAWCDLSGMC